MEFEAVRVQFTDDNEKHFLGEIDRVWHGADGVSISVSFGPRRGPNLPLGRAARLGMKGGPFKDRMEISGMVVTRMEDEQQDTYHLRFGGAVIPTLRPLFECRLHPRVVPEDGSSVPVALRSMEMGSKPVACKLADISLSGIGLDVPQDHEGALAAFVHVRMGFALSVSDKPLVLNGRVRHRFLKGAVVRYGIEFEEPSSPDDVRFAAIKEYVQQRLDSGRKSGRVVSPREEKQ